MPLPSWANNRKVNSQHIIKSSAIAITSGAVRFACSIITAITLGRLLTPEDFGLIGMALPIFSFIAVFSDGGVSTYTLQSKKITQKTLSLTFWLGALFCFVLFLIFLVLSQGIAYFYQEERLENITLVLSISILLGVFTIQHNALIKKSFRQDIYAKAEIIGAIFGLISGISLALLGAGYWALVAIPISRQLSHAATIWNLTRWIPDKFTFDKNKSIEILSFGFYTTLTLAIFAFIRNADKVLIGWKFSATELGYYTMAYSIMMLPSLQILTPVGGVIIPYFNQLKNSAKELNKKLSETIILLGVIVAPIMLWAAYISEDLILVFLGEKWKNSSQIFSYLSIACIAITLATPSGWTLTAFGKVKQFAFWTSITIIPILTSYLIGLQWGALGVAKSFAILNFSLMILFPLYASRHSTINFYNYIGSVIKVLVISLLSISITILIFESLPIANDNHIQRLLASMLILIISSLTMIRFALGYPLIKKLTSVLKN